MMITCMLLWPHHEYFHFESRCHGLVKWSVIQCRLRITFVGEEYTEIEKSKLGLTELDFESLRVVKIAYIIENTVVTETVKYHVVRSVEGLQVVKALMLSQILCV